MQKHNDLLLNIQYYLYTGWHSGEPDLLFGNSSGTDQLDDTGYDENDGQIYEGSRQPQQWKAAINGSSHNNGTIQF